MNKRTISPAALHLHIALRSGHDEADRVCPLITTATAAAVRKYEELRSNACGGSSERGSEQVSSASSPVPVTPGDAAAPAVDPRRLTDGELWEAYLSAWRSNMTPNNVPPELGEQGVKRLRAVANAQLAKARVTISEAEIDAAVREIHSFRCRAEIVKALLRRHGVEVTP